jgi:hypothetical protein
MKALIIPICKIHNPNHRILSEETVEKLKKRGYIKGIFSFLSPVSNKPDWTNEELEQGQEFLKRKILEQEIVRKARKYFGNSFVTKWLSRFILDGSYEKLRTIIGDIFVIIFRIFLILILCITFLVAAYLLYLLNK